MDLIENANTAHVTYTGSEVVDLVAGGSFLIKADEETVFSDTCPAGKKATVTLWLSIRLENA